ncbi:hypothetical protein ACIBG8_09400 [Nonomuraea sp. NPDC050556]|uniref:hypothetical protein n=1 Tax=Nonomuraea sp. NPDC050556 TaxID=3364369 RepID=UPI00378871D6
MHTLMTPQQHVERGCVLLAEAAGDGIAHAASAALAQRAAAHFHAAQALNGLPRTASPAASAPTYDDRIYRPAAQPPVGGGGDGIVLMRLDGSLADIADTIALLEGLHIHLDNTTTPQPKASGESYLMYATLDIGAYRVLADGAREVIDAYPAAKTTTVHATAERLGREALGDQTPGGVFITEAEGDDIAEGDR